MSLHGAGGVRGTIDGVAGALLRVPVAGDGPGGEVRKVFLVGPWGWRLESSADLAGVALVLGIGAPCRGTVPEECVGRSVVSLVLSCVSRCPETAPGGEVHKVFLVGPWGWRLESSADTAGEDMVPRI